MARRFVSRSLARLVAAGAIALACMSVAKAAGTATTKPVIDSQPWTGDFDGMFERRHIRMLVPYSRTLFYLENGKELGLTADLAHDFANYLNHKHAKELAGRPITISLIPTTRERLLTELVDGMGDISGGNLTATASRMKMADFVSPTERDPAHEVLVSGPGAPAVASTDDLSGKKVNVRLGTSYLESMNDLNAKLGAANQPPVQIVTMPDALEDEDVLEMLNAGLLQFTIVDSWKAKLWAQVEPQIKVHDDVVLRNTGTIAWAIRKQSPKLQAELEGFYKSSAPQGLIQARLTNYQDKLAEISKNSADETSRFDRTLELFRKYGKQYPFDPLMLAAEGLQESQLGMAGVGHGSAATGRNALPAPGAEFEKNVQAGTKYADSLMTRYFPDAKFSEQDRTLFTFASYSAGPDNIERMRREAQKRGLDPNQWFNNVELLTAEKIGIETTAYVRGILKYNIAYKLINEGGAGKN